MAGEEPGRDEEAAAEKLEMCKRPEDFRRVSCI